ncbi:citrate lyase beta subunit [Pyrrhoderma noxium]|uniref:Citrate lyase beta subunit n=1 Tax=Pyrrhoderma noxium TaxID=2282107 RepID=A0A286UCJ6_9AGAM|nr:citrate lyase beta subunit [Pyrrhoderma noxium]
MLRLSASGSRCLLRHQPRHPAQVLFVRLQHVSAPASIEETPRLRRSYLYVPSSDERKLNKSLQTNSDVIIYDLEDSVDERSKDLAREKLHKFLTDPEIVLPFRERIAVRVNAVSTRHFKKDVETLIGINGISTIVLPKIHGKNDLDNCYKPICKKLEKTRNFKGPLNIVASIESAQALVLIDRITNWEYKGKRKHAVLSGLLFAAEDYCADTSITRTKNFQELLYARSKIATYARAYKLEAIDMVCTALHDPSQLQLECQSARELGFSGKQAIHPDQVETILNTFVPSDKEIERAQKILSQMAESNKEGKGAFGLVSESGASEMIDEPMVKQATNTLRLAKAAGKIPTD